MRPQRKAQTGRWMLPYAMSTREDENAHANKYMYYKVMETCRAKQSGPGAVHSVMTGRGSRTVSPLLLLLGEGCWVSFFSHSVSQKARGGAAGRHRSHQTCQRHLVVSVSLEVLTKFLFDLALFAHICIHQWLIAIRSKGSWTRKSCKRRRGAVVLTWTSAKVCWAKKGRSPP